MSVTLPIVLLGDPILYQVAQEVPEADINTPYIQELIEKMKNTLRANPGVGLAAPQVGVSLQIAVIEHKREHFHHLPPEKLRELGVREVPFHVIINPKLTLVEAEGTAEHFEGCSSVSDKMGITPRAKRVHVECLNEKGEHIEIDDDGWHARILQHEIDHLNGVLFSERAYSQTLMSEESLEQWKGKTIPQIKDALCK